MDMTEVERLQYLMKLKGVERKGVVKGRPESSAEHSWSCMMLAEYFLNMTSLDIDRDKVMKLLLFHDVIEIETGDVPILERERRKEKAAIETKAKDSLKSRMPSALTEEYDELFSEYLDSKTLEARFARAIDALEPVIDAMNSKEIWRDAGFDEKTLRAVKEHHLKDFPELLECLDIIIAFMKGKGYID